MIDHTFNFLGQDITLRWSDENELFKYLLRQRKAGFDSWQGSLNVFSLSDFFDIDRHREISIIDVGSGVGILSLLLYHFFPRSTVYLLDEEYWPEQQISKSLIRSADHPIYNSWSVLNDAILTMNLDRSRIVTLSKTDPWPKSDLVLSLYSWCWHYPLSYYYDKLVSSLGDQGRLVLTVSNWPEQNIERLDDILNKLAYQRGFKVTPNLRNPETYIIDDQDNVGYLKGWIKNNKS